MSAAPRGTERRLRVLVLAGVWPHVRDNTEAANVVLHEMISNLLSSGSFDLALARITSDSEDRSPAASDAVRALEARGMTTLPTIRVKAPRPGFARRLSAFVSASPDTLLPGAANAPEVLALCESWKADCALTVWCESGTAALYGVPIPRMAYYGNPDHKTVRARWEFEWENRPSGFDVRLFATTLKARLATPSVKRAHLRVMRSFDAVGDVSANDAAFYSRRGVRAVYIRNMWPTAVDNAWERTRDGSEQTAPLKIVGNVGALSTTGNTRGLHALGTVVLPALKRVLGEGQFEVHLFGGRQLHPYLTRLLDDPHIRLRGFVPDLDAEILSSPIFLVTNNHSDFKVGNTRFLHAWSLGSCVVTFGGSALGMPELVHRRNVLLASTPDEMAELVAEAGRDQSLRRSLGRAGADAVATEFDPASVTKIVADRLISIVRERGGPRGSWSP